MTGSGNVSRRDSSPSYCRALSWTSPPWRGWPCPPPSPPSHTGTPPSPGRHRTGTPRLPHGQNFSPGERPRLMGKVWIILVVIRRLSYRREGSVETLISTSPSQWRDENRIQTRARHTEKHHVLVVRKCILSSTLQGLISDTSTPGSILRVPDTANIFFSFNFFFCYLLILPESMKRERKCTTLSALIVN